MHRYFVTRYQLWCARSSMRRRGWSTNETTPTTNGVTRQQHTCACAKNQYWDAYIQLLRLLPRKFPRMLRMLLPIHGANYQGACKSCPSSTESARLRSKIANPSLGSSTRARQSRHSRPTRSRPRPAPPRSQIATPSHGSLTRARQSRSASAYCVTSPAAATEVTQCSCAAG